MFIRLPSVRVLAATGFALLAFSLSGGAHTPAAARPDRGLRGAEQVARVERNSQLARQAAEQGAEAVGRPPARPGAFAKSGPQMRAGVADAKDSSPK